MNFQVARANMVVQQVQPWHVADEKILAILAQIPREIFVLPAFINLAYSDSALPLYGNQTLLPPKIVARALQALKLNGTEKVLEIGTGTGYVTACLSKLVASVVSVEIEASLIPQAEKFLANCHCRHITLKQGDGILGWEKDGPYDAIMVTGSYPLGVPEKLCEQLKPGGRLFAITGVEPSMQAVLIERDAKFHYKTQTLFETVVPALLHAPVPKIFQF